MTRRARTTALTGLVLSLSLSSSLALAEGASSRPEGRAVATASAVEVGNVPAPNGGIDWGRAEGIVNARSEDVLAILHDYSRYAGLFPYFQKSKVLSQRGGDAIVYLEAKILHGATTLWGQVRMSSKSSEQQAHVVEAKLMKGKGNMAQLVARWEVTPVNDGAQSRVVFQLLVDPDLPVPNSIISREMKNGAGQAFRALRRRVTEHASLAARTTNGTTL